MTTPKLDVAPKKPRSSRTASFGENLMRGISRAVSFEASPKGGIGRTTSNKKNATFPQRGVRKASSFKDSRKRDLNLAPGPKQRVSFGKEQIHTIECVCSGCKSDLWYTKQQLMALQKIELRMNLISQLKVHVSKKSSNVDEECTWRGMEDLDKEDYRKARIKDYVRTVVLEHHLSTPSEEIQKLALSMSKDDKDRAYSLGLQDEVDARPPSKIGGRTLIGRTLSGSMKLMRRSNPNLPASNKTGGLASAA